MSDIGEMLAGMNITHAEHLPVVAAFIEKMKLVDTINAAVPTEMAVDIGTVVKLMVLDTLSGRSPLYRLEMFAKSIDTGQNLSVVDQLLWPGTAVLRLLKRGLLNKEIANELNIATKTVEFHVTNILRKLQCSDRIELIDEEKLVTFINYSNNYTHTSGNITTNCICS